LIPAFDPHPADARPNAAARGVTMLADDLVVAS
jgi:hypothetical protein